MQLFGHFCVQTIEESGTVSGCFLRDRQIVQKILTALEMSSHTVVSIQLH